MRLCKWDIEPEPYSISKRQRFFEGYTSYDFLRSLMMMAVLPLLLREIGTMQAPIPTRGLVTSTVLSMLTMAILAICLSELQDPQVNHSGTVLTIPSSPENTDHEQLGPNSINKMAYDDNFNAIGLY
jgi:hypothetical protein